MFYCSGVLFSTLNPFPNPLRPVFQQIEVSAQRFSRFDSDHIEFAVYGTSAHSRSSNAIHGAPNQTRRGRHYLHGDESAGAQLGCGPDRQCSEQSPIGLPTSADLLQIERQRYGAGRQQMRNADFRSYEHAGAQSADSGGDGGERDARLVAAAQLRQSRFEIRTVENTVMPAVRHLPAHRQQLACGEPKRDEFLRVATGCDQPSVDAADRRAYYETGLKLTGQRLPNSGLVGAEHTSGGKHECGRARCYSPVSLVLVTQRRVEPRRPSFSVLAGPQSFSRDRMAQ